MLTASECTSLLRLAAVASDDVSRVLIAKVKVALRMKQFERLINSGKHFGILTAYGPFSKNENKRRQTKLLQELQKRGYRNIEPLTGSWEGVSEHSVLVPNMAFDDLVELGKEFDQDSVIYKDPSGVVGMYYPKDDKAEFAVKDDGDIAAKWEADEKLYSKSRNVSFEFGFLWGQKVPWNGSSPYTRKGLTRLLETGKLTPPKSEKGGKPEGDHTYEDYVADKKQEGGPVMKKDEWEARYGDR